MFVRVAWRQSIRCKMEYVMYVLYVPVPVRTYGTSSVRERTCQLVLQKGHLFGQAIHYPF